MVSQWIAKPFTELSFLTILHFVAWAGLVGCMKSAVWLKWTIDKSWFRAFNLAWLVQETWTMDILLSNCSHGDKAIPVWNNNEMQSKTSAELVQNLHPRDLSLLKKIPPQKNSHENNLARKSYKIKYRAPTHFLTTSLHFLITRW